MSLKRTMRVLCAMSMLCAAVWAQEITGTVTNQTTGKPSAGDNVVLMKLVQGMDEVGKTTTDSKGHFTVKLDDPSAPHLIRVSHRNVNYFKSAPPGTTSVEVNIYDAAEKVEGIKQTLDIMRIEADATSLRVLELFALENASKPPRTLMSLKSFEVKLPKGAKVEQAMAAGPGGMPVTSAPVPQGDDRYSFLFPIRPGETRFQVSYTLPYSGNLTLSPSVLQPVESLAVSVPTSMKIEPASGSGLQQKGEESGMAVFVANNVTPGKKVDFTVSGTGTIPETPEGQPSGGQAQGGPGGGIGTPINTPNPLTKYQWWIVGGVAVLMVVGAAFAMKAQPASRSVASTPLDALKEEMFHLESDRLQGKISEEEYAQSKAALDVVMKRALGRKS